MAFLGQFAGYRSNGVYQIRILRFRPWRPWKRESLECAGGGVAWIVSHAHPCALRERPSFVDVALEQTKEIIAVAGYYVAGVVWDDVSIHPYENPVLGDLGGDDAAFQSLDSPSHSWAVLPVKPPARLHSGAVVGIAQWLNMLLHIFEWKFVQR